MRRVFNRENAIDVLTLLETQHKEVDALFEAIEKVKGLMTEDERLGLGNEVLAMFEELMQKHPCIPTSFDAFTPIFVVLN